MVSQIQIKPSPGLVAFNGNSPFNMLFSPGVNLIWVQETDLICWTDVWQTLTELFLFHYLMGASWVFKINEFECFEYFGSIFEVIPHSNIQIHSVQILMKHPSDRNIKTVLSAWVTDHMRCYTCFEDITFYHNKGKNHMGFKGLIISLINGTIKYYGEIIVFQGVSPSLFYTLCICYLLILFCYICFWTF